MASASFSWHWAKEQRTPRAARTAPCENYEIDAVIANTLDTVEIYRPPYLYYAKRPQITPPGSPDTTLPDMHYGEVYELSVADEGRVDYAVLMGVASITHHFDYGQRYVELMVRGGVDPDDGVVEILPPPEANAAMAPEGPYLLFVVKNKASGPGFPSVQGEFLKLRFAP